LHSKKDDRMKPIIFTGLFLFGILGIWLTYWDISDFITTGLNTGVWNGDIVIAGLPSICAGIVIIAICVVLGVKVLFK